MTRAQAIARMEASGEMAQCIRSLYSWCATNPRGTTNQAMAAHPKWTWRDTATGRAAEESAAGAGTGGQDAGLRC